MRRKSDTSISLFPFLAVLVCTMGALILLLLVTTRRIRHQQTFAVASLQPADTATTTLVPRLIDDPPADESGDQGVAALPVEDVPDDAPDESEDESRLSAEEIMALQAALDEATAQHQRLLAEVRVNEAEAAKLQTQIGEAKARLLLAESDDKEHEATAENLRTLTALRQQEDALKRQLVQSQGEVSRLHAELRLADETTQQVEQILVNRESALLSLRQHVSDQQAKQITIGSDSTVIEFSNPTGTAREPIIVEITGAGMVFRPGEVRIAPQDLQGFPARDNPLLSGVLALHRLRSGNSALSEPYVLLLVRPEGTTGFYMAQRILKDARIHFGYELVEADREIATGTASDEEAYVLRESLLAALGRRQSLYAELQHAIGDLPAREPGAPRNAWTTDDETPAATRREGNDALAGRYYAGGHAPVRPPSRPRPFARLPEMPPAVPEVAARDSGSFTNARPRGSVAPQSDAAFQVPPQRDVVDTDSPAYAATGNGATGNGATGNGGLPIPGFDPLPGRLEDSTNSPARSVAGPPATAAESAEPERLTGPMRELSAFDEVAGTESGATSDGATSGATSGATEVVQSDFASSDAANEFWNNLTPIEEGNPVAAETGSSPRVPPSPSAAAAPLRRRDSRAPSGWSESFATSEPQTSRTAGPAGTADDAADSATANSYVPSWPGNSPGGAASRSASNDGPSGTAGSAFAANGVPGAPASAMTFGATSNYGDTAANLDPELLKMLDRARQAGERQTFSRQDVTVFLDPQFVTVASQTPRRVDDSDFDAQLLATLQGVSEELKYSPGYGSGRLVPVVRFIVSPGAERMHLRLAGRLAQLGIPTAAFVDLSPHVDSEQGRTVYSHNDAPQAGDSAGDSQDDTSPGMPVIRPGDPHRKARIQL